MAVFTTVDEAQARAWLADFAVGELLELHGIASGVENTNYFVTTAQGRYVLTLFEKLTRDELPFYLALMGHLAGHDVPCPRPIRNGRDEALGELNGKPAALMTCLPGAAVMQPQAHHCAEVGRVLGRMHQAGRGFGDGPDNPRGPAWWRTTAPQVMSFLDAPRQALLEAELRFQAGEDRQTLPRGPVHADLFRDNVLFDGDVVGGVIDFYFAGVDAFLFDVAVTLNDWCIDHPSGTIIDEKADAFLAAYAAERPFTEAERAAWPGLLRAAALRFWLSRLYDFYLPRAGELIRAHDPEHFHRVLALRVADNAHPPRLP
jgi:homoserine kinase type II